jgi:hypothetical protein
LCRDFGRIFAQNSAAAGLREAKLQGECFDVRPRSVELTVEIPVSGYWSLPSLSRQLKRVEEMKY